VGKIKDFWLEEIWKRREELKVYTSGLGDIFLVVRFIVNWR
jgi:hypothetical protein